MEAETKKRWIIAIGFAAIVIVLYYYLGSGQSQQAQQVVYPNTQASGVPASANPASVFNIATPQVGPSPAAIYAPSPVLPATPAFQSFNYAPLNIYGTTSQAASTAPVAACPTSPCASSSSTSSATSPLATGGPNSILGGALQNSGVTVPLSSALAPASPCCSGGDSCSCGCSSSPTGGTFIDGNASTPLAANPVQQATNPLSAGVMAYAAASLENFFAPNAVAGQ